MTSLFKGKSLEKVFELREKYCVIGLTGRTASGVTDFAESLKGDFKSLNLPKIDSNIFDHNNGRKYKICYDFLEISWKPFKVISYKDVITLIILSKPFDHLLAFLETWIFDSNEFSSINGKLITKKIFKTNKHEVDQISELETEFNALATEINDLWADFDDRDTLAKLWNIFTSDSFIKFSEQLHDGLQSQCCAKRIKILQTIGNSYRRCGMPYCNMPNDKSENVFKIAELINYLIKGSRRCDPDSTTRIVIDSLRNPLEVMYFKERYSAFYMFSINRNENERQEKIKEIYKSDVCDLVKEIDIEEYESGRGEFNRQNVMDCIQKSDVHINKNSLEISDYIIKQEEIFNPTNAQILKIISLILHPGLITPSPQERCMQIAFSAKYNSGCISRQVGAAVTDEYYSIKSIGWNNTAENQVPCLLRSAEDLLNGDDEVAFSEYERSTDFKKELNWFQTKIDKVNMKGHNCSFCFKDMQNYIEKEKNQVHTRSLHAEENAFLQIAKYGGASVKNGILFTTASPCELCSKKAYQLGIEKVYYIDPYPGIAKKQILKGGTKNPKLILFVGAIGRAYHKLYEPFMAYKDEMMILSGLKIANYKKVLESENDKLRRENKVLRKELEGKLK